MGRKHVVFLLVLALGAGGALAQHPHASQESGEPATTPTTELPPPQRFVTSHSGRFGGETVRYTATAGETYIKDDKVEPTASVFSCLACHWARMSRRRNSW